MRTDEIVIELRDLYQPAGFDAGTLVSYMQALEPYSHHEVREASRKWQRQSKWMPRPAELIELIREARSRECVRRRNREIIDQARGQKCSHGFRVPPGMKPMDYILLLQSEGMTSDEIAAEMCG